ncbi:Ppx/GppA phosphatase family protein [Hyphococcus formosus]|uniref:Ppx/GppA phosphatase family protein n=1 Tax=Hyphococcus formosus TaxID=3143534 RepID=UPI00398BB97A
MTRKKRNIRASGGSDPADRPPQQNQNRPSRNSGRDRRQLRFAAIDLGTNNCRLLIAAPRGRNFRIVDAFSRIVRLGEGLGQTGRLSDGAMDRAVNALKVCAQKIEKRGVTHIRCIATQACRGADNGEIFLERVTKETGLEFEIIPTEEEARLAVVGCAELLDPNAEAGLIFDIGGGSTEMSWVKISKRGEGQSPKVDVLAWTSLPFGVVSLADKWDGREITREKYDQMIEEIRAQIISVGDPGSVKALFEKDNAHLLGTSGTVTSIAGVHLGLKRYRRDEIDGVWLSAKDARGVTERLRLMSLDERAGEPCIGPDRADLVVCGCAILDALQREWPASRIRVADRGLREGILADLAQQARREHQRSRKSRSRRRRKKAKS